MSHSIVKAIMLMSLVAGLAACERGETENEGEGAGERVGREIDSAMQEARPALEDAAGRATDALRNAGDKTREALRAAGDEIGGVMKRGGERLENESAESVESEQPAETERQE